MKIGLVTDNLDLKSAGIGSYARNLSKSLIKIDKKNKYVFIHNKKNNFYKNKEEIIMPSLGFFGYHLIRKFYLMPKRLINEKFDILHDTYHFFPYRLKGNTKRVVTIHDIYSLINPKKHRLVSTLAHKFFLKKIINNVDKIIVPSRNTKKDLIEYFGVKNEKIEVIPECVDEDYKKIKDVKTLGMIRAKYSLPVNFILFVGTIEPRKNIIKLVEAFEKFKTDDKKDTKLIVVGKNGWKYKNILKKIETSNFSKDIIRLGYISREDLPYIYNLANIFVYPSVYEGFGLPPLEAMSCGVPTITSDTSSLPEVVGDSAIKVNPENETDLKEAMNSLINNKKLRKKYSLLGLKRSKLFSWNKSAKATIKVYEDLVK